METIKTILITISLLIGVAFIIASWYIVLGLATVVILYLSVVSYRQIKRL